MRQETFAAVDRLCLGRLQVTRMVWVKNADAHVIRGLGPRAEVKVCYWFAAVSLGAASAGGEHALGV